MADLSENNSTSIPETKPDTSQAPKKPVIDKELENEIGTEVEQGQLSSDELNSGNDL